MREFEDDKQEKWQLTINVNAMKRVRARMPDVDLMQIDASPAPDKPNLSARLMIDPLLTIDVIFCLLEPDAQSRNVSDENFGERMGGRGLKNALTAFWEELTDFFRQLGRSDLEQIAKTQQTLLAEIVTRKAKDLAIWEAESLQESLSTSDQKTAGSLPIDSQGSSELTQAPTPSESWSGCLSESASTSGTGPA